jgi:hypothetical protein
VPRHLHVAHTRPDPDPNPHTCDADHGRENREKLHEMGDPTILAFKAEAERARRQRIEKESGIGPYAPQWRKAREQIFELPRYRLRNQDQLALLGGPTKSFSRHRHVRDPAEFGGAVFLQRFWRDRRTKRATEYTGWLLKTASGGGPIERLREYVATRTPKLAASTVRTER